MGRIPGLGAMLLLAGLVGCGGAAHAPATDQAVAWVNDGAVLLDVRTPGEFASGHLDGAVNIPVDELADRLGEIEGDQVVVYCRSGHRSAKAAAVLEGAGKQVTDLGAMGNWPD
jgi:phage shock protein E